MKVAIVGVGGVGQVCASELVKQESLEKLVLADICIEAAMSIGEKLQTQTRSEILVKELDARNVKEMTLAFKEVDVVLHTGLPENNFYVMQACINAQSNYIDMASVSNDSLWKQLSWDKKFKQAGILGIMGLGCDPGFANIAARYGVDELDTVTEISIRDGDCSNVDYEGFCMYFSPKTAIEECLALPNYWTIEEGERVYPVPFANKEEFEFPEPVGRMNVYNVDHEEQTTLGETIGRKKGCKYVDFKYALPDDTVNALKVIRDLGLNSEEEIEVKGVKVAPIDMVVALMPRPAELAGKIHGFSCIGALVKGTKDGKDKELFIYTLANHDEVYKQSGFQATVWQTGIPPVVAVDMIAEGTLAAKGCIPPELIEPKVFMKKLKERGMQWYVREKSTTYLTNS
ncbi:saccharopine dehydrogenase C-terminal domain-containing protein [Pseudobacillus sp. FSL P4-0506]|uniref:saccharopine dehydrogenase family protein n=1 Tax=Pseudobacillus sp. FSL P4-0506 TaxID=2921576 RepID=UPI0030FAAB63